MGNGQSSGGGVATANATNPYENVMTRSRSVRSQLLENQRAGGVGEAQAQRLSYLPKMQGGGNHGGIIMPSMRKATVSSGSAAATTATGGSASAVAAGGVDSPQWGWYINTTVSR